MDVKGTVPLLPGRSVRQVATTMAVTSNWTGLLLQLSQALLVGKEALAIT